MMQLFMHRLRIVAISIGLAWSAICCAQAPTLAGEPMRIVTRKADTLYEGDRVLRFLSLATPNLHLNESQIRPDKSNILPDDYEVRDLLDSLVRLGGTVTRPFSFSVSHPRDAGNPAYITGRRAYNEHAFRNFDRLLAMCNERRVRLIVPLLATQSFPLFRGVDEFAAMSGRTATGAFFTDARVRDDFKHFITWMLNRRNTVTGVRYKDDPAILAWQLGNEYGLYAGEHGLPPDQMDAAITAWSIEMAAHLKRSDPRHLVMEGGGGRQLTTRETLAADPHIDIMSSHPYEFWLRAAGLPAEMGPLIDDEGARWRGQKAVVIDEFGMGSFANIAGAMAAIRRGPIAGGLLWSLRGHRRDGGFYYHNESGSRFDSYHYPGFNAGRAYDEASVLALLRREAFAIRGLPEAAEVPPAPAPVLFERDGGLVWRGSTGASSYEIQKGESKVGPWRTVAVGVQDSLTLNVQDYEESRDHKPLQIWRDGSCSSGQDFYYRSRGINSAGATQYSNQIKIPC